MLPLLLASRRDPACLSWVVVLPRAGAVPPQGDHGEGVVPIFSRPYAPTFCSLFPSRKVIYSPQIFFLASSKISVLESILLMFFSHPAADCPLIFLLVSLPDIIMALVMTDSGTLPNSKFNENTYIAHTWYPRYCCYRGSYLQSLAALDSFLIMLMDSEALKLRQRE